MAGITLKGEVKFKGDTVNINETFTKRELWIEIDQDTDYPQTVNVEFIKDKCSIIDKFNIGDHIEVDVNIRGNVAKMKDNTERCFNSLNGWRVRGTASGSSEAPPTSPPPAADDGGGDDLPF